MIQFKNENQKLKTSSSKDIVTIRYDKRQISNKYLCEYTQSVRDTVRVAIIQQNSFSTRFHASKQTMWLAHVHGYLNMYTHTWENNLTENFDVWHLYSSGKLTYIYICLRKHFLVQRLSSDGRIQIDQKVTQFSSIFVHERSHLHEGRQINWKYNIVATWRKAAVQK